MNNYISRVTLSRVSLLIATVFCGFFMAGGASATTGASVLTPASASISADSNAGSAGAFTPLAGPVIKETASGQISGSAFSISLIAPSGFKFNPSETAQLGIADNNAST